MAALLIRRARPEDLDDLGEMIEDFVRGHPAKPKPRSRDRLREAYFGKAPVARLFVAERDARVVGMGQWYRIYDVFWSTFGGYAEWLYVRPAARCQGVSVALIAAICDDVRSSGGEFINSSYSEELTSLYERFAVGFANRCGFVSGEGFQAFADLAGRPPRDIVRGLPSPALTRTPPIQRRALP